MKCSKLAIVRFVDVVGLTLVYLLQNVILNYIIIYHHSTSFFQFLWFLGDFFCILLFSFTVFMAHTYHVKLQKKEKRSASRASFASGTRAGTPPGSSSTMDTSINSYQAIFGSSKLPFTWGSWIIYSILIILKIYYLLKSDIPQKLSKDDMLGPQMFKFCIGLSAVVFTLLVESHHNAHTEPLRNAYLNSVSFEVALEILDSVSFLALLLPSEAHLTYSYMLEDYIIVLASINLMLPAFTIFKISASDFGRIYNIPLEVLYKVLHLVLVNLPFMGLRIYLWSFFSVDTSVFLIKNIYAIVAFIRGVYPDAVLLIRYLKERKRLRDLVREVEENSELPESPGRTDLTPQNGKLMPRTEPFIRVENGPRRSPPNVFEEE